MYIDPILKNRLACSTPYDLTPSEFYELVMEAVRPSMPMLAAEGQEPVNPLEMLDYGFAVKTIFRLGDMDIDEWREVRAEVELGGSEGVFLTISIGCGYERELPSGEIEEGIAHQRIFVLKTLDEGPVGYAAMGVLAGMLKYAVELFLITNL